MTATLFFVLLGSPKIEIPVLFDKQTISCRQWAESANQLIQSGENKAVEWMINASETVQPGNYAYLSNVRICHIARTLFTSKSGNELRAPMLGGLMVPYKSMPLSVWPEFPLVQQDGVFFVLSENYVVGGQPEPARDYIAYLQKNGQFRNAKLKVPTDAESAKALENLFNSKRWKEIKWKYESANENYAMSPGFVVDFLKRQTVSK